MALFAVQDKASRVGAAESKHYSEAQAIAERILTGEVLAGERLGQALRTIWVQPVDKEVLDKLTGDVTKAEQTFHTQSPTSAIPSLEHIVSRADALLPHASADPDRAKLLLKAHLLLWWALEAAGEKGRLKTLMAETVERFPTAVVDTTVMPPGVTEAFVQAKGAYKSKAVTVSFELQSTPPGDCTIRVNGFDRGEGRLVAFELVAGRTYYIQGACEGLALPPRRLIVSEPETVALDLSLAPRLAAAAGGDAVMKGAGPDQVAAITELGASLGSMLGVNNVILVGVYDSGQELFMQLDRVNVTQGVRVASVRLTGRHMSKSENVELAMRAVWAGRPTPDDVILFANDKDNVYRSVDEYIQWASDDQVRVWTWTSSAVTAAALTGGVIFSVIASSNQSELEDCVADPACGPTAQSDSLREDLNNAFLIRNSLLITGALAAVGTGVLFFLESPEVELASGASPGWSFDPWVSEDILGGSLLIDLP